MSKLKTIKALCNIPELPKKTDSNRTVAIVQFHKGQKYLAKKIMKAIDSPSPNREREI